MKKMFSHGVFKPLPRGGYSFDGALMGGGAHALTGLASVRSSYKIPKVGVLGTPKVHWGNVPLGKMRPAGGPFAAVQGKRDAMFGRVFK